MMIILLRLYRIADSIIVKEVLRKQSLPDPK
jgi:hypothetical protein